MTEDQLAAQPRIVAGVDGSDPSRAALAWAVRQARLTGATVEAVIAWKPPAIYGLAPSLYADFPGVTVKVLTGAIAEAGDPAVIRPRVMVGHAAKMLVEASAEAELLVAGSHRHHRFPRSRRGSVSLYCAQHAHCPVVVIHDAPARAQATPPGGEPRAQPLHPGPAGAEDGRARRTLTLLPPMAGPMQKEGPGLRSASSLCQDLHPKQRQQPCGGDWRGPGQCRCGTASWRVEPKAEDQKASSNSVKRRSPFAAQSPCPELMHPADPTQRRSQSVVDTPVAGARIAEVFGAQSVVCRVAVSAVPNRYSARLVLSRSFGVMVELRAHRVAARRRSSR